MTKKPKPTAIVPAAILVLLPFAAWSTPAYTWDLRTWHPHAEALPSSLTSQQLASLDQLDAYYPTAMTTANGTGLTAAELNEVAAMPAYFALSRDPSTGALTGRDIVMDGDESAVAQPDVGKPASFYADFTLKVERLTELYAKATTAQAPQLEQVYSDLIEHFLDLNYLPGGRVPGYLPVGNGYLWRDHGWKTLRMMNKLSADKRDLYAMSLAHVCGFSTLLPENSWSSTDVYYNYYATANKALALMSDTPAKWQLVRLVRRGMDVSTIGWEDDPVSPLVPRDGSVIHHNGYASNYTSYSYAGQLVMHTNWTTAGFTSSYTAQAISNMRRASLAWCFTTTGGLNPLHQIREGNFPSGTSLGDGGAGNGPDFALKAANLTSAYYGTPIANDLEMAYAAISKTGVGSTTLPTQWRTITPPSNPEPNSPLYTATLQGHYSRTTTGTSIQRGPGNWVASLRGQPSHWTGAESRSAMGLPPHFIKKMLHGSLELITTGKNGRKPNEVDSGYRYEGWNPSYYPNVTCPDYAPGDLLYWQVWAYFGGESNLMGGANLRDSGIWMNAGTASKSAFFLGNRIVLVTNNITGNGLHTGLIQTAHDTPASEPLVLDGTSNTADGTWTLAAGGNHKIVDPRGNAYYVHADPATPQIQARRGNQDWTYALASQWTGTGTAPTFTYASDFLARMNEFTPTTANYSRVWFDHGATATNQALEYTVLVKPQAGDLDTYAAAMANPATAPVTVTQSAKMHRYRDRSTGTHAIAVFDPNEAVQMGGLATVNRAGAYIWRTDGDLLRLSVSSSETENTAAFQLALTGEWTLDSQQDTYSVTVTPNAGGTAVSISYRDTPQSLVLRRVMPQVVVTVPANNATVNAPVSQTIGADVTTHGHTIAKVQFFDGTILIGEDATAPYSVTWTTTTLGSHNLSARAVISAASSVDSAPVAVSAVNTAPVFNSDPVQARAVVNTPATGQLAATDSGASETLTYAKVSGPAWLTVAADGTLGGTPSSANLGSNTFTVRVTDSYGAQASATLTITVGQTNAAPVFTANPITKPAAIEDTAYTGTLAGSATDADAGDWLTYSKVSGPAWLQVAANGALGGPPSNGDVGANTFVVKATDGAGASVQATLNLNVTNVNDAPLWTNPVLTKVDATAGTPYSASVTTDASDADPGDTLSFSKVAGPAWLNVAANGALSGTPTTPNDSGLPFTLRVMDSAGASADATLTLMVNVNTGDGTWLNAAGGTWNTVTNWNSATLADGANRIADFSTLNLTTNAIVTLDSPHTIGQLKFGDTTPSHNWTLNGSSLTLLTTTGNPTIQITSGTTGIGTVLTGFQGFTKTGAGALTLSGANTYTGVTTIADGSGLVTVNGNQTATTGGWLIGSGSSATTTVTFAAGSQINVNAGKQIRIGNTSATGTSSQTLNAAGTVENAGSLLVGRPAVLNLNTGGTWDQSGTMSVAAQGGYSASCYVKSGSIFSYYGTSTVKLNAAGGSAYLTIDGTFATTAGFEQPNAQATGVGRTTLQNGGTLKLAADVSALSTGVQFTLGTGGGVINTNGFTATLNQPLTGNGGFTKAGAGTLFLTSASAYTGPTLIGGGLLAVNGSLSNGAVTVGNTGTLGGGGTIGGAVTVQAGGTLAPSGAMTVNNTVGLAGNTVMTLGRTGAMHSNTQVKGVTTLTYGGTLTVTDVGTDALAMGDTFQLFSSSAYTGIFSGFTLPALPGGLSWHTGRLAIDGTITVGSLPLAVNDNFTTTEDTAGTFAVMANDSDPDNDTLTLLSVTQGAHGSVTISGSNVTYTPAANYNGTDSFTYTVTDSSDGTAMATVSVTVTPMNDAPTFTANPITGGNATEDSAYSGSIASYGSDIDAGDTLTFSKVSGPSWLTVASNGALSGTPLNGDVGANAFTVKVTDAAGANVNATLNIAVANVNDAPVFTANPITGGNATEDSAYSGSIASYGTDVDAGDSLTFSKVSGPAWLSVASNGALSGTPGNSDVGANSFTVKVTDAAGANVNATLNITVVNVNDAPTFASALTAPDATSGMPYTGNTIGSSASDVDAGDALTYSKVSGPSWLVVASTGTLSGTPGLADGGSANVFTVRATDGTGAYAETTLTINVIIPDLAADPDGDGSPTGLEFTVGTAPFDNASVPGSIYTNLRGWWKLDETSGTNADDATGRVQDGTLAGSPASTAGIVGNALNLDGTDDGITLGNAPSLSGTGDFTVGAWVKIAPGSGTGVIIQQRDATGSGYNGEYGLQVLSNGTVEFYIYNGGYQFDITTPTTYGLVNDNQWHYVAATRSGTTGTVYVDGNPLATASGTAKSLVSTLTMSIGWDQRDNNKRFKGLLDEVRLYTRALSASELNGIHDGLIANRAPAFTAGSYTLTNATVGSTYAGTLVGKATDADTDVLTFAKVSGPSWLTVASNGTLSGTPAAGDAGTGSYSVSVTDPDGQSATASLSVTVYGALPSGWTAGDIGSTGVVGSSGYTSGTGLYTISGAGADIWGTADAFQYASTSMTGDGEIRARVTSQSNTGGWAKAGVMMRDTTAAGSAHAMMVVTPSNGFANQYRATTGASSSHIAGPALNAYPNNWVRVTRCGSLFTTYVSSNGTTWTQVGQETVTMGSTIRVGLAVDSTSTTTASTATFDNVTVTPYPSPWVTADVGTTGVAGRSEFFNNVHTLNGAGVVGGTADGLRYTYQALTADGDITVRIPSFANTGSSSRIGVMIRDTLSANSAHVFLGTDGSGAFTWTYRTTAGGSTTTANSGTATAPNVWVRLTRVGNVITAYSSTNGTSWTTVGSQTVTMASNCYIGLAVGSGNTTGLNASTFDNVTVTP